MRDGPGPEAVLITGAYGSGKSAVIVEIADMLEDRGLPFAAIDLDWLAWAGTGRDDGSAEHRMLLRNLASVVDNYLDEGVRYFVLARAFQDRSELDSLIGELALPLKLVRLTVPAKVIEERLDTDITSGRHDDLREVTARVARSEVEGIEDRTVSNDRPIRETATGILEWLGWT